MTTQTQNKRDSFIFYRSFFSATKCLNQAEKSQLFDAICSYALDNEVGELGGTALGMFELIKPQLDANRKRFQNGCVKKQKISKTEAKQKQKISKTEANVNDNVNLNDNVNVNQECKSESINDNSNLNLNNNIINQKNPVGYLETKDNPKKTDNKRFAKPKLEELISFCNEFALNIDPQQFIDYYDANGWKINKNPMKDWQATARNWHRRNADKITTTKKSNNVVDPMDFVPSYDYEF
jgi:hypothetical protein